MPLKTVNDVQLFYELTGNGTKSIVLVHGSWSSHHGWDQVVPLLQDSFRVLTYDRRGHSQSERFPSQGSIHEDVADLAALIEEFDLAPAWVVGNSFGGSIAVRLAGVRPDLMDGMLIHEPPLLAVLAERAEFAPMAQEVKKKVEAVADRIANGDHRAAAKQFVNEVALGPGSWDQLPPEVRDTLVQNAPTFLDEANDPDQLVFDAESVESFDKPALVTTGSESPQMFSPIIDEIAAAMPDVQVTQMKDAGHIPHITHPEEYTNTVLSFIRKHST